MYKHHIEDMVKLIGIELGITGKDGVQHSPEAASDMGKIRKALDKYWDEQIAIIWTHDDVISCAHDNGKAISKRRALEVLDQILDDHDANEGINWDVIYYALPNDLKSWKKSKKID